MEPQNRNPTEDGGSNKAAEISANMLRRESHTRWIPTTDHIRILKELFYNKGVRSPTIEQIQRICLQLKWYGKIEFKNVYFWFVNQRAREKKKKKSTSDVHVPMQRSGLVGDDNVTNWKHEDQYINFGSSAPASASSASVMIAFNGQIGNYGGYGSMNMENSARDCSISVGGRTSSTFFDMNVEQTFMEQRGEDRQEIETLSLFPVHGEDIFGNMKTTSDGGGGHGGGSYISLELSLSCEGKAGKSFWSR
ncbi:putative transcription factor Homobox-WOX family [Rosa chinensis]|uniref:Putative transcription factor Homobox-WOX family n=1 Tax=Rosa chinensis TaxID=74649 RepID=A0A2P6SK07_ROSCH|nr:protein WUSCHEL [Rosa chinensis]PRQ59009.1 putative transcription factor Homobox-WOX family [Rosa chinensis]